MSKASTARSEAESVQRLRTSAMFDGKIAFPQRKHFFTDQVQRPKSGRRHHRPAQPHAVSPVKTSIRKPTAAATCPVLPAAQRSVTYIPSDPASTTRCWPSCAPATTSAFTPTSPWADVTIPASSLMTDNGPVLRNASSRKRHHAGRRFTLYGLCDGHAGHRGAAFAQLIIPIATAISYSRLLNERLTSSAVQA